MVRNQRKIGGCPKCGGDQLACNYNHFETAELTIDSWEHKCPDCGFRDTKAFRTDEEESIAGDVDVAVCPYCGRRAN